MMNRRVGRAAESVLVVLILAGALALRSTDQNRGMWQDEVLGYEAGAAVPFIESVSYQPTPVYHVLAYLALYLSPEEWAFRLPSLAAGIAGILLTYLLVRRTTGVAVALLAAAWLSASTFHIASSVEARFYAVMMLMAPAIVETLTRALVSNRRKDWLRFWATAVLGCLLQTTMLLFLFGIAAAGAVWLLLHHRPRPREWVRRLFPLSAAFIAAAIPVAVLAAAHDYFRWFGVKDAGQARAVRNVHELTPSEYVHYFSTTYFPGLPAETLAVLWALAVAGIAYLTYRNSPRAAVLIGALVLPPIPLFLIESTHFYHPRYFAWVVPLAIWLIAAGVHGSGLTLGRAVQWMGDRLAISWLRSLGRGAGTAVVAMLLAGALLPHEISNLHRLNEQGLSAGLHEEQDNKRVTELIRALAQPHDFAHQFWSRPDWHFYYRDTLASYLVESATAARPLYFWYLDGYGGRVDANDLPSGAKLLRALPLERPYGRTLYQYEVPIPELRLMRELSPTCANTAESGAAFPFSITLPEDHGEWSCATTRAKAIPHQFIEFVVEAQGPPQVVLTLEFFDAQGDALAPSHFAMRSPGAVREPHPAGAGSPMPEQEGKFALKLATVTPPLTASVSARISVQGDTRAGDRYTFHAAAVRANWHDKAEFRRLHLPGFGETENGVPGWTVAELAPSQHSVDSGEHGTPVLAVDPEVTSIRSFTVDSILFPVAQLHALLLSMAYKGEEGLVVPELRFYDADRRQISWFGTQVDFYTEASAFGRAPNLQYSLENGGSRFRATTAVPSTAAFAQLRLQVNPSETAPVLQLQSPEIFGY